MDNNMRDDLLIRNPEAVDILSARTPDLVLQRLTLSKNADNQRMVKDE